MYLLLVFISKAAFCTVLIKGIAVFSSNPSKSFIATITALSSTIVRTPRPPYGILFSFIKDSSMFSVIAEFGSFNRISFIACGNVNTLTHHLLSLL